MALLFGDASSIISVDIAIDEQAVKNPYKARRIVVSVKIRIEELLTMNKARFTRAKKKWIERSIRFVPMTSMILPAARNPAMVPIRARDEMISTMLSPTIRCFLR